MKEFIKDGSKIIVNVPYAEAYIAKNLFSSADKKESSSDIAYEYGEGFAVMGVFNMRFFDSPDNINREKSHLRTFNYPNMIETYPTENSVEKLVLIPGQEVTDYRIFKYYKGDVMMDANTEKNSKNCEKYLKMINMGKIPTTIKYTDLINLWLNNFAINGFDPGVAGVTLQAVYSELCRDPKDPSKQFRKVAGLGNYDTNGYFPANMRQVTSYSSVFNAMTFETISDMLVSSINMSKDNVEQNVSPIEVILTM